MSISSQTDQRVARTSHVEWVPIAKMKVSTLAQREFRPKKADRIAKGLDPDRLGFPVVSLRDSHYYIVDGQHRIAAVREALGADQAVQCEVFHDLTEAQEADLFLWRDDRTAARAFEKFRIALTAGRDEETDIERTVLANGYKISEANNPGCIRAVTTLRRVYALGGPTVLGRTLRLLDGAYGADGTDAHLIEGIALVCHRYNGQFDDASATVKLSNLRGGMSALLSKAYTVRRASQKPMPHCVAAAVVEVINGGKGGRKLPGWWSA